MSFRLLEQPLVSVLMPAYNAELYIKEAIESIVAQTYTNWELLVCDDGSTDRTLSVIETFSDARIKKFKNERNVGNLATMNFLLGECRGDLITMLDADDWCTKDRIANQVQAFVSDNHLGLCGTQSVRITSTGSVIKESNFPVDYDSIRRALPSRYLFTSASVMFRKELVADQRDPYPVFFGRSGGADWYFLGSMIIKHKMINLPCHSYFYRYHGRSVTNSKPASCDKYIIGEVVVFLLDQQLRSGRDGLSDDEILKHELTRKIEELRSPYRQDETLLERKYAIRLLRNRTAHGILLMLKDAILNPLKACSYYYKSLRKKMVSRFVNRKGEGSLR